MKKSTLILLFVSLIGSISAVFLQEVNLASLVDNPITSDGMIFTADQPSYFQPPQNWLEIGEWKDNSQGASSYVQRPPGYGLLFLLCKVLSPENPYVVLKAFQVLAFFFSVFLIGKIVLLITSNIKLSIFTAAFYGLMPCYSGFMYYSLTEGITPFLLLAFTYQFIRVYQTRKNLFWFGVLLMIVLLVRPQLIIFTTLFSIVLFLRNKKKWYVFVLAVIPFFAWQVRTYNTIGSISIHPIYSYTNASLYRPPHEALTNLFRIWEYRSDHFHETVKILASDTTEETLREALERVPVKFQHEVEPLLIKFQKVVRDQTEMFAHKSDISALNSEVLFVDLTNRITKKLKGENIVDAYLLTPVKSSFELLSKSHLNLSIFQSNWRGSLIVELLRWLSLSVILFSLLGLVYLLFCVNYAFELKVISLSIVSTILYLIFIQRLNEERYMTPLLPVALIILIVVGYSFAQNKNIKKG